VGLWQQAVSRMMPIHTGEGPYRNEWSISKQAIFLNSNARFLNFNLIYSLENLPHAKLIFVFYHQWWCFCTINGSLKAGEAAACSMMTYGVQLM
jgi:hypothetical protein